MDLADKIIEDYAKAPVKTLCGFVQVSRGQWNLLAEAGRSLPDVDWRQNALTLAQHDYCADAVNNGAAALQTLFDDLQKAMARDGVCVLPLGKETARDQENFKRALTVMVSAVSRPFGPFLSKGFWQTLGVDAGAKSLRAHSTGYIPFHFDLDQAAKPPEFVTLACVRPDPFGNGESLVVDYKKVFGQLSDQSCEGLGKIAFSFSGLLGTFNIGAVQNPHALVEQNFNGTNDWICRYNGKARPQFADGSTEARVFDALETVFKAASAQMMLKAGDVIMIDQRRVLHARQALAVRPEGATVTPVQDRLLLEVYGNPR